MLSASRRFARLGLFTLLCALATAGAARAEIDLNRLVFPKVPSSGGAPMNSDEPPPEPAFSNRDYNSPPDSWQPPVVNQRAGGPQYQTQPARPAANQRGTPASYQSSAGNPAPNRGAQMQQTQMNSGAQAAPTNSVMNSRPTNNYGEINYSPRGASGMQNGGYENYPQSQRNSGSQWSVAGMLGMESRGGMQGPNRGVYSGGLAQNTRAAAPAGPMVTPEAVYLEGETIPPGMRPGARQESSVMSQPSGGMMMEGMPSQYGGGCSCGPDGFSNPYCNDCNCRGPNCGSCGECDTCGDGCGFFGGLFHHGNNCGQCDDCNECGHQCPYGRPWILAPIDLVLHVLSPPDCGGWWWGQDFNFFAGVHNFRSNVNITNQSNFGTQEGVNWALPLWSEIGLGGQIGIAATQSNFQRSGFIFDDYRQQTFITGGLFHRPACNQGFQYGVVFDWLHDEFYENFDVAQIRGEISYLFNCRDEIGFEFGTGVIDDESEHPFLSPATFDVISQYNFFYRRRFCRGGDGRVWAGFTDDDRGLAGVDFSMPISRCWALEGGFNYVFTNTDNRSSFDETWNVGMNLVWYIGGNATCRSQYRPLFNVADNGTLLTRIVAPPQN